MSDRHNLLEFFLAIFQVDGIDDRFALAVGERLAHGDGIRRVNHDRGFDLPNQLLVKKRDVFPLVPFRALQAYIHNVRAAFHLPAPNLSGFFPFFFRHQVLEQPRPDHVRAFTYEQRPCALFRLDRLYARIHSPMRLGRSHARFLALDHLRNRPDVLFGGAAAATNDIQPAMFHESFKLRRQRCRRFEVFAFLIRQSGIRVTGYKLARQRAQRPDVVGHKLRARGAVHSKCQRMCMPQRSPHRFHGLPGEHRAHRFDCDRDKEGNRHADFLREFLNREDGRFDVSCVLAGFH